MTPAEISATLKRCGVPASAMLQELIALNIVGQNLLSYAGQLAQVGKSLQESAKIMADRHMEAE